ncbi:MAG TPA: M20 family peptidase, partial [Thermomicrobiales bacterium]|nr:M20 family peptidase [Thermomicrobiales bacterium]
MAAAGNIASEPSLPASLAERVLAEIHEDEVIGFLQGLVQIPSANPPGDVREAIDYCIKTLEAAGFACRKVERDPIKPNLIAEFGDVDGPVLCFNAHV